MFPFEEKGKKTFKCFYTSSRGPSFVTMSNSVFDTFIIAHMHNRRKRFLKTPKYVLRGSSPTLFGHLEVLQYCRYRNSIGFKHDHSWPASIRNHVQRSLRWPLFRSQFQLLSQTMCQYSKHFFMNELAVHCSSHLPITANPKQCIVGSVFLQFNGFKMTHLIIR